MVLAFAEGAAEIIGSVTALFDKRTRLGAAQHVREMSEASLDTPAIEFAIPKRHHVQVVGPLITYKK
ncbi:hypothetical protein [Mycobacterium decipiens]|uniref:Uncharacterized protein n=1 Tax=Mycobacterium decipiens TaxID=1430326 RepID=A0A1X2LS94_9MYCO|nr:hypothetical protein [Mycobacterium decipiens]OSC39530.1 hypothetical protein B8W66_16790 [Mycobacterium decipiens]